jgi:hypothetical protein
VDSLTHTTAWLVGLIVAAVVGVALYIRYRKPAVVAHDEPGEATPVAERSVAVDPMIGLLRSRLFDFENGSGDNEKDEAVGIILTSGHRYGLVSVYELDYDDGIVRVHDLQRNGRRIYIRIRDISAIEGSEDE